MELIITLSPPPVWRHLLQISWNPHIQIFLQHSICPVLGHFCRVKLVFSLVYETQMSCEAALVVFYSNNIATCPTQQMQSLVSVGERKRHCSTYLHVPFLFPSSKNCQIVSFCFSCWPPDELARRTARLLDSFSPAGAPGGGGGGGGAW